MTSMTAAHAAAPICRPLQGLSIFFVVLTLGLTPQGKHLSPLRGSDRMTDAIQRESGVVCGGAPEARQMTSPGREPRGRGNRSMNEPLEGATEK